MRSKGTTRAEDAQFEAQERARRRRRAISWILVGVLAVAAAIAIAIYVVGGTPPLAIGLTAELRDRGRVAVVGDEPALLALEAEGAEIVRADRTLEAALTGVDEEELDATMARAGVAGLLVDAREPRDGDSIGARLTRFDQFRVLKGVYLTPIASLYARQRSLRVEPEDGAILARAARQIAGGARLPNVRSFPEPLHRSRSVEVLVMFRQGGTPKLWRSARGGSIARALITASSVARDRWNERRTVLGGSMDEELPGLRVEVYLLEEDGTIGDRTPAFLERVITSVHGVAVEERGAWHYLLPRATEERGGGSVVRAYQELFADANLDRNSLERSDLRFYRIVARLVGTSAPSLPSGAGLVVPPPPLEGAGASGLPGLEGL